MMRANQPETAVGRLPAFHIHTMYVLYFLEGKWTTYRSMAKDAVDKAVEVSMAIPPSVVQYPTSVIGSYTCCYYPQPLLGMLHFVSMILTLPFNINACTLTLNLQVAELHDEKGCQTDGFFLDGGEGWSPTLFIRLIQDYGFDIDVCTMHCNFLGGGGVTSMSSTPYVALISVLHTLSVYGSEFPLT